LDAAATVGVVVADIVEVGVADLVEFIAVVEIFLKFAGGAVAKAPIPERTGVVAGGDRKDVVLTALAIAKNAVKFWFP